MKRVLALAALLTSSAVFADDPAPPQLTPEGKKLLDAMLGRWTMKDAVLSMGGKEVKCKVTFNCEKAAGGWATACKGVQDCGKELPRVEGLYTFAWDVAADEGHMLEVESSGTVHNHVGRWQDDKTIVLTHAGKSVVNKDETDVLTATFKTPNELALKAEGRSGGATQWTFTGVFKK